MYSETERLEIAEDDILNLNSRIIKLENGTEKTKNRLDCLEYSDKLRRDEIEKLKSSYEFVLELQKGVIDSQEKRLLQLEKEWKEYKEWVNVLDKKEKTTWIPPKGNGLNYCDNQKGDRYTFDGKIFSGRDEMCSYMAKDQLLKYGKDK